MVEATYLKKVKDAWGEALLQLSFILGWGIIDWIFVTVFALVGVCIGFILYRYVFKPKNEILYFRERDGRVHELGVQTEDAISLETKGSNPLRFWKHGRSYEGRKWGRAFTRFLAKEGTAFTWILEGFHKVGKKMKAVTVKFKTLEDCISRVWPKEFYDEVPEEMKAKLREDKLYVTVNLEPGFTPEGYKPATEQQIKKKANEDMASLIARGVKGLTKQPILNIIFSVGTGIAIGIAVYHFLF